MADGKLDKTQKAQLGKFLGYTADFKLLFKATRDGISPAISHQRCDRKGATVTIAWNTDGCIFGGFTSQDSACCPCSGYQVNRFDNEAFLFTLSYKGKNNPEKFTVKNPENAVIMSQLTNLNFGNDLIILPNINMAFENGTLNSTFTSDSFTFGTNYNNQGMTLKDVTNDNYTYEEVEIYQVQDSEKLEKQWREFKNSDVNVLKKFVTDYCPVEDAGVKQAKILLVGSVGAGKSSFFNTINSIFRGRVTSQASAGSAEHSLTIMFRSYQIRHGSSYLKFRLCDTRGVEDSQGINVGDVTAILDGHMPDRYSFNPVAPIPADAKGYIKTPTLNDKIHCVTLVIDASSIDVMTESVLSMFKQFQKLANQRGIPQVILLTKVDQISLEVEQDLSKLPYCSHVAYVVDQASQLIGLPRGHVLPVKNYECETDLNNDVDRFSLLALRQMLRFADDFMYDVVDDIIDG